MKRWRFFFSSRIISDHVSIELEYLKDTLSTNIFETKCKWTYYIWSRLCNLKEISCGYVEETFIMRGLSHVANQAIIILTSIKDEMKFHIFFLKSSDFLRYFYCFVFFLICWEWNDRRTERASTAGHILWDFATICIYNLWFSLWEKSYQ